MWPDLLRQHPLLADAPEGPITALAAAGRIRRFSTGEVILRQGDAGDGLYFIRSGTVKIVVGEAEGGQVTVALLDPPESFGELAVLDSGTRSATAVALTAAETLFIRRPAVLEFLRAWPPAQWRIVHLLCQRLRNTDAQLANMLFLDVDQRLARVLLRLAAAPDPPQPGAPAQTPPLTQQELAELVGASRESVNKVLQRFVAEGAVERTGRRVTVLRADLLRDLIPAARR